MSKDNIVFQNPPSAEYFAAAGGKKEADGPLAASFDLLVTDTKCGQKTWEMAESVFQGRCLDALLKKACMQPTDIDLVLGGDLQCQCTASTYNMRGFHVPFVGLYGACSTMTQAIGIAAVMVESGNIKRAAALASSHFCTAERQFRTPLDYGGKRTPTAQWTTTAAGAVTICRTGRPPFIKSVTFGRIQDFNIKDINNMGAAMAPAAADTLLRYFAATGNSPTDFDKIYTGDLGAVGSELLHDLLNAQGVQIKNHEDCGLLIYERDKQNVQAGGSGAGCSAAVLAAEVLPALKTGRYKRVLFMSTGALMSQTTFLQGESIPSIAHLVELWGEEK